MTHSNLKPDTRNANKGTHRGRKMLEQSLRQYGAGRSILADKNGVVIAGNKTLETAAEIGLPVRVIETDGSELVVVQRTDLDLDRDPEARAMAYADNRTAEVDLAWDMEQLAADLQAGVHLEAFWPTEALETLQDDLPAVNMENLTAFQPNLRPETSAPLTTAADMQNARREMEARIHQQREKEPIVCPYCAGEFFVTKGKGE